jgi:hypothetical protein
MVVSSAGTETVEPWLTAVIVVPAVLVVFALFLVMWRARTSDQTARVAAISGIVLLAWLVGTGILAWRGFYLPPVSGPPPVGVQLTVALIGMALALMWSPSLRSVLTNQKNLVRLNVWRLVGAVFVTLMFTDQVPALWALPAGLGDVAIGATAFWVAGRLDEPGGARRAVAFNLLGLLDLVVAVGLGMTVSPGPTQLFQLTPSGEVLTHFPLVLVPTFLVPLAVMVHVVSLRQLLGATWTVRQPA